MRLRDLDLNLLVALDALLREAHVTRAAARLEMSQSSMSLALSKLRTVFNDHAGEERRPGAHRRAEIAPRLADTLRHVDADAEGAATSDPSQAHDTVTDRHRLHRLRGGAFAGEGARPARAPRDPAHRRPQPDASARSSAAAKWTCPSPTSQSPRQPFACARCSATASWAWPGAATRCWPAPWICGASATRATDRRARPGHHVQRADRQALERAGRPAHGDVKPTFLGIPFIIEQTDLIATVREGRIRDSPSSPTSRSSNRRWTWSRWGRSAVARPHAQQPAAALVP